MQPFQQQCRGNRSIKEYLTCCSAVPSDVESCSVHRAVRFKFEIEAVGEGGNDWRNLGAAKLANKRRAGVATIPERQLLIGFLSSKHFNETSNWACWVECLVLYPTLSPNSRNCSQNDFQVQKQSHSVEFVYQAALGAPTRTP